MGEWAKADKSFIINNNTKGLIPIRISLPEPPNFTCIDGYGKPKQDQYFRREIYPEKLSVLEKEVKEELQAMERKEGHRGFRATGQKVIEEIWYRIENNIEYYAKEIDWIKKQWWHRLYGYWFFNNGTPTYIDGWHWFYLNNWFMGDVKGGYPEYRERDRLQFLFFRYLYTTTETFKNINPETFDAIKNERGEYEMIDIGYRTFYGAIQPKNRRGGNTNIGCCIGYEIITRSKGSVVFGIQSFTENQASSAYEKILMAWAKMPFYFKPIWEGDSRPTSELFFTSKKYEYTLGSKIDYAKTSEATYFDGKKQVANLSDEEGKTKDTDINYRWSVNQNTLSTSNGGNIFGFSYHPSTVANMNEGGGDRFYSMFKNSNFYQRGIGTGQTVSGLASIFFPGWDCMEKYVDKYGQSITDAPTAQQIQSGFDQLEGSRIFLQNKRDHLLKLNTPESLQKYREERQLFPFDLDDCFTVVGEGNTGMDIEILERRMTELRKMNPAPYQRYDMEWESGIRDTNVILIPNSTSGRFFISNILNPHEINRKVRERVFNRQFNEYVFAWRPEFRTKFMAAGDTIKFNTKNQAELRQDKNRLSNGGGAVFWRRDKLIDPDSKVISDWISYRFICTYNFRPPTLDDYCEDMIKMVVYFGAMMFPENNIDNLWKYFIDRGYSGYLAYGIDPISGKPKEKPGWFSNEQTKPRLFDKSMAYIKARGHAENHYDYLNECKSIRGIEYMTDFDLFAACSGALLGDEVTQIKYIDENKTNKVALNVKFFGKRRY